MWSQSKKSEEISLEKILYIMIQLIQLAGKLDEVNIFSYLELAPKTLMIDLDSYDIRINSDLTQSFKLLPV